MRSYVGAEQEMGRGDYVSALAELAAADSLQRGGKAIVFPASVAAARALCLLRLGRRSQALLEARRSLALWRDCPDGRYVVAVIALEQGRTDQAAAEADTMLEFMPGDERAMELGARARAAAGGR